MFRYLINKIIKFKEEQSKQKIWREHGSETRFHFNNPNFSIGEYSYGIPKVAIYEPNSQLFIGKFCSIAEGVVIHLGGEHIINEVSTFPFFKYKTFSNAAKWNQKYNNVYIGNDVWIGRNVLILSGIKIGDGAIIGAGAVVSKNIPPYAVAVGSPIKILRYRASSENINKLLKIKWWDYPIETINKLLPYMNNMEKFISECENIKFQK